MQSSIVDKVAKKVVKEGVTKKVVKEGVANKVFKEGVANKAVKEAVPKTTTKTKAGGQQAIEDMNKYIASNSPEKEKEILSKMNRLGEEDFYKWHAKEGEKMYLELKKK